MCSLMLIKYVVTNIRLHENAYDGNVTYFNQEHACNDQDLLILAEDRFSKCRFVDAMTRLLRQWCTKGLSNRVDSGPRSRRCASIRVSCGDCRCGR